MSSHLLLHWFITNIMLAAKSEVILVLYMHYYENQSVAWFHKDELL